jgi:hypothetical protein
MAASNPSLWNLGRQPCLCRYKSVKGPQTTQTLNPTTEKSGTMQPQATECLEPLEARSNPGASRMAKVLPAP